ncbi:small-conductance mechanosensitive channel [Leptolyngbya sp. Heron Island J]|uniref:cyclic nucleotide-binding domain-containing protein n=1 Tax=Leptolyngbya sp. Heron Island J TaxID=1385935 RepID=UPI0003B97637|nr:cyclic nucleotide-binding domain-containing protein [Leptolyngbya sp. Heron Island J]ESA33064.1 small-conductance mechanosensitive channel [Leptolyngbya sp. Heron Island J]
MPDLFLSIFQQLSRLFTTKLVELGNTEITLKLLLSLSIWLTLILFAIGLVKKFLKRQLLAGIDANNREAIAALVSYVLGAIAILVVVQNSGINLRSLGIILGGLGVGIGFGLQHIADDFISGLIMLFERTLKVNDLIELDDYRFEGLVGRIIEVNLRSTIIRTLDDGDVVIPNNQLVKNRVLNWSHNTSIARLKIPVGVSYDSDPILVTELLLKSAYMEPAVCSKPMPKAMFLAFGEDALQFELWVWVDVNKRFHIQSSLHFTIEYNLRQHNIEIAFPQRDVWIRNLPSQSNGDSKPPFFNRQIALQHRPQAPSQTTLRDMLRQVSYFANFSDLELRQLIEIGYRQRSHAGTTLFHEGDAGNSFYILLEGKIEILAEKLNRHLATIEPGQFFGEVALLLGVPRTAMARVAEDALLFVINQPSFSDLLRRYPELSNHVVQTMAQHREELAQRQREMRALNLVDSSEDDANPVIWARKRIKRMFDL